MKPRLEAWLSGLSAKLAASFFAVALLVLIPSLGWFYTSAQKLTEERIDELLNSLLVHDSALLASSIENRDFWQLYRLARAMASPVHVLNVAVVDKQGRLLAHSDSTFYNQQRFDPSQTQAYEAVPLEGLTGLVGYVLVERDKQGLKSYFSPIKQRMLIIALVLVSLAALLGLLLAYVWQRHLEKEQSLAFLGELATELAHEIRNDLAPVKLLCELGEFTPDDRRIMQQGLNQADKLLETFMTFAKSGLRQDEPLELEACLTNIEAGLSGLINKKQADFALEWDTKLGEVEVAAAAFSLVVMNLARNALQAIEQGGWVRVRVCRGIKGLRIEIKDDGPGISPALAEKIFEPFISQKKGGTGLGLMLVRRHVQEIGGQLSLANLDAGGCIFTVEWPLAKVES